MSTTRRALLRNTSGLLAGCDDAKGLKYQTWMMCEPGVRDYWNATIEAFKKANNGINLALTNTPVNAYEDKVSSQIAAGSVTDILPVFSNQIHRLLAADLLEPLDDRLANTS